MQLPIIQRVSQWIILAFTLRLQQTKPIALYLRDILQAYVQSNTYLSRDILYNYSLNLICN